jgi:hypothetical protein
LNLRERTPSISTAVFDATLQAGGAILLADRIRRNQELSYEQMLQFAKVGAMPESQLRASMALLKRAGLIEYTVDPHGVPLVITEQVGVAAPLLEQCHAVWELAGPSDEEAAAVQSAELGAIAPMALSDHQNSLEAAGFPARLHPSALVAAKGAGLLYEMHSPVLGEAVLFSPYVWKTEALNIAEFFSRLPPNERELLMGVSEKALQRPGLSESDLKVSDTLLRGARRVGLIDATRVQTATNQEQSFVFSPMLERSFAGGGSTETTHHRKLFTAHILYGHRYGNPATGRIENPIALVRALIRDGTVRPSTAARTDFLLLESAGIVRVEEHRGLGRLQLVKDDVARDSLELLRSAVEGDGAGAEGKLWLPRSQGFVTPENDRASLANVPIQPGAEAEALTSSVEELRTELGRKVRGEEF